MKEERRGVDFASDSDVEGRNSKNPHPPSEEGSGSHTAVTAVGGDGDLSVDADNPFQPEGSESDEGEQETAEESDRSLSRGSPRITNTDEVQTEQREEHE